MKERQAIENTVKSPNLEKLMGMRLLGKGLYGIVSHTMITATPNTAIIA